MAALNAMARTARGVRSGMVSLADQVAEWFDRQGPEKLEGNKEYPVAYAAAAVGVSRQHLYRLRDMARVRRLLADEVSPPGDTHDSELPEKVVRPLTKLLADRPEEVGPALQRACEIAAAEGKAVNSRHTNAAVEQMLPPEHRTLVKRAQDDLLHQIDRCLTTATATPRVSDELLTALTTAKRLASEWVQQSA